MKKPAAALLFLLSFALPASTSEIVFDEYFTVPKPGSGSETVHVQVRARNDTVVVKRSYLNPDVFSVYTKTNTAITISKHEEWGGYAHGIAYRVNDGDRDFILYSYYGNGSVDLKEFNANATLRIKLYRIDFWTREYIGAEYSFVTSKDTIGPTINLVPKPGAYRGRTSSRPPPTRVPAWLMISMPLPPTP